MDLPPKHFGPLASRRPTRLNGPLSPAGICSIFPTRPTSTDPGILPTLRMSCCPPLAVDRLVGLAKADKNLVKNMEKGKLAVQMPEQLLALNLASIVNVVQRLLDPDIFVWIPDKRTPTADERHRASTIVADRLTGAIANPIIRNAQEKRQLHEIASYLNKKATKGSRTLPGSRLQKWNREHSAFTIPL